MGAVEPVALVGLNRLGEFLVGLFIVLGGAAHEFQDFGIVIVGAGIVGTLADRVFEVVLG